MNIDGLASELRNFQGIRRKRAIASLVNVFESERHGVIASFGEDAAVIDMGDDVLLISADGIWDRLMSTDPVWAGYCSVLVNIHDIAAMGGRPIAIVDVFSVSSRAVCEDVSTGMKKAVDKFDVPIVGGHLHPDTEYDALDTTIIGTARKDGVIFSHTARANDDIIAAVDLHGMVHPSCDLNWDSTTYRDRETLQEQLDSMRVLGESHLVTAGKDISNPGLIGTIGMLLEMSGRGAIVDINAIPMPKGLDLTQWLKMYPGMGFVVTANPTNSSGVISIFKQHGLSSARIGMITDDSTLTIMDGDDRVDLFDFKVDCITGLRKIH